MSSTGKTLKRRGESPAGQPAAKRTCSGPHAIARELPMPRISNVVSTFTCNTKLDLLKISQRHGLEFQPSRFAACSVRLAGDDRSTALAFTSGK